MWQNSHESVEGRTPIVLGHEFAAIIVESGKNIKSFEVGMKVVLAPNIGCGICDRCVAGNFHLFNDYKVFGINITVLLQSM